MCLSKPCPKRFKSISTVKPEQQTVQVGTILFLFFLLSTSPLPPPTPFHFLFQTNTAFYWQSWTKWFQTHYGMTSHSTHTCGRRNCHLPELIGHFQADTHTATTFLNLFFFWISTTTFLNLKTRSHDLNQSCARLAS